MMGTLCHRDVWELTRFRVCFVVVLYVFRSDSNWVLAGVDFLENYLNILPILHKYRIHKDLR